MTNGNPLQNVARSITKGTKNAASNGNLLDATKSAVQGTVSAGKEVGRKNVAQAATNLVEGMQQNQK
ncbi:hypothetical protein NZD89_20355 [Alicyclobacillus fastidiosus]|uniref:Uncharacterized protein n=1 Tax=Alicyclobacillus fastidiosus TaxID=392011 RepID=A0ABY6ZDQ4_9BACL|nr:hypothetical protein [Alicyclobacillus fastidiosus]WAH40642.1 hypothetical protein NZD89_20355 [Alicyclobacillus fastidiosus]GMA62089.1 hypothetical protein GCM10025859_25290 [Alicyclobacillus fastidiosus]